jgi:hypothetical protein
LKFELDQRIAQAQTSRRRAKKGLQNISISQLNAVADRSICGAVTTAPTEVGHYTSDLVA